MSGPKMVVFDSGGRAQQVHIDWDGSAAVMHCKCGKDLHSIREQKLHMTVCYGVAPPSVAEKKPSLEDRIAALEKELAELRERVAELEEEVD